MQVSDLLGKYNTIQNGGVSSVNQNSGIMQGKTGLSALSSGSIFEGTIGQIQNGQAELHLSNGSVISARISGQVSLQQGQSIFFQVKSNDGQTIEIKPYESGTLSNNPTVLTALSAASLATTEQNVEMVNQLMQEGMSIDKQSLNDMARLIGGNQGVDMTTLIQMTKLGLPITDEMMAQFQNYKTDSYQILGKMTEVLDEISNTLGKGELSVDETLKLNDKLVDILANQEEGGRIEANQQEDAATKQAVLPENLEAAKNPEGKGAQPLSENSGATAQTQVENQRTTPQLQGTENAGEQMQTVASNGEQVAFAETEKQSENRQVSMAANTGEQVSSSVDGNVGEQQGEAVKQAAVQEGNLLQISPEEKEARSQVLQQLQSLTKEGIEIPASLRENTSTATFLQDVKTLLENQSGLEKESLKELLSGKAYRSILQKLTEDNWLVKPEELTKDKVKDLYHKLDSQMRQTETLLREMGLKDTDLGKSVTDLKGNLQFMNEINQAYTYVQIPLQFQNQNAHSDLYVYTNKKNLADPDGELTAFLHLDMKHLGSTDVSVRMKGKVVNTKFYMEDDLSYELILKNAEILAERLEEKGFSCSIDAVQEKKEVDFVEDFLKQGQSAGKMVHRYSFDMRA